MEDQEGGGLYQRHLQPPRRSPVPRSATYDIGRRQGGIHLRCPCKIDFPIPRSRSSSMAQFSQLFIQNHGL